MKKKVIEGFMKSTCAVVSAACLVTSIPVSAASISENDVYETNVENDQSIESDNSEETLENTDLETEDDQTKSVEKVVENKSETDLASYFTLDYASMTADEFNEAVQDLSMEDLWLVMSAQSDEVISYLLSLEGCILGDSRTVYIIDKETEELKDTIKYDTTYEYLKDTFDNIKFTSDQDTITTQVIISFSYQGHEETFGFSYNATSSKSALYVSLPDSIDSGWFEIESIMYRFNVIDLGYANEKICFKIQISNSGSSISDNYDYFKGYNIQVNGGRLGVNEQFTKSNGVYITPTIYLQPNRSKLTSQQTLTLNLSSKSYKLTSNTKNEEVSYSDMQNQILNILQIPYYNGSITYSSNNTNIGGSSCQINNITKWLVNGVQMTASEISKKPKAFFAQDISIYPYSYTAIFSLEAPRTVNNVTLTYNVENAETGKLETKTVTAAKPFSHYLLNGNVVKARQSTSCVINQKFANEITIPVTLSDNVFTRDNYTFRGWSTDPNGSAMYTDKQSVRNLTTENGAVVTLYAVWTKNQYTINFDGNGGSVTTPSIVANMGEDVQLPTATKQYKVDFATNGGYLQNNASTSKIVDVEFRGWSTNKDFVEGTDKLYTGNEKDLPTVNVNGESVTTLYAVWGKNPSIELPKAIKDGYEFINWSFTKADGVPDSIPNGNVNVYSDMTITASWRKIDNGPDIPTPAPTPSKDYTEEMKNILNILQNITTTQDLTSQQISQLTTLIKEVCFNDVDSAVVEKLIDMIKNSNLSENVKKAIFEALASGSISEDLKSTLINAIKNSNLSEYEKSQLISAIEKMSTLSLDEQKKILQLLTQGSSVTYKIDGIEYLLKKNTDGTLTIGIKNLNGKENVVIPDSVTVAGVVSAVTEISKEAFKNNTIIKTVKMGNNVTKIGDSAFEGCKNLKSVTIGPAVTNIGNKAFKGCTSLTKINIPKSVLKIGNSAFEGCSKLKTVTFHEGLLQIGNKAFYKCSALTKVKLPKSLLKAGSYAFSKCKKLKTVTFATDANVTTLGKGIFADNASFKTIKIPSKVTAVSTKMFRNNKKLSKVTGLSGVTKINANAFENCKSLKTITLQKNVQTIGSKAFYNCSKLSKVTIKSNAVTNIGSKAFKKCKKAIKFKVPNSKVSSYKKLLKGKY